MIKRNMPMIRTRKTKPARKKTNLKIFSVVSLLINFVSAGFARGKAALSY